MQYLLPCPCGHAVPVARSQAGMTVVCPQCNTTLDIPTIRGMANLVSIAPGDSKNSPGDSSKKSSDHSNASASCEPSHGTIRRALTAVFFMVFIVAGVATGRWAVIRFLTPTPFTVEDEIQQGAENLSSFTPSDAWDAWQFYQSAGFKEKNPAPYYRIKRVMELQDETMRTGAVVTAIAFVCLMAVLFAPKRKL